MHADSITYIVAIVPPPFNWYYYAACTLGEWTIAKIPFNHMEDEVPQHVQLTLGMYL